MQAIPAPEWKGYWQNMSPDLIFVEVTGLNRLEETMQKLRHLTPGLLLYELMKFRDLKGYMPRVVAMHIPTAYEEEIRNELAELEKQLEIEVEVGYEGLIIQL